MNSRYGRRIAISLLLSTSALSLFTSSAFAQVQIDQTFLPQGPGPAIGPRIPVGSADNPPNGSVAGAVQAIVVDPVDPNTLYLGAVNGGVWKTTDGGTTWTALSDKQASLSIASLTLDPSDPTRKTIIAGTGLTSNGAFGSQSNFFTGLGGLQNGLLRSTDGGATWTQLGAGTAMIGQSVVDVAGRGNTILAATFEPRANSAGASTTTGALYRSTDGGATFTVVSGAGGSGLPLGPVTSLVGNPANPGQLFAAVTKTTGGLNTSTAVYVSNDTGATWTQVFGAAQSGGTIQAGSQTSIRLGTGPGGAVAAAVVNISTGRVTGLFWSGNSGVTWTQFTTVPNTNPGGQGPLNVAIAIDPNNNKLVYVSGDNCFATCGNVNSVTAFRMDANNPAAAGVSLTDPNGVPTNTGNGSTVHPDVRALVFDTSGRLLMGNDGGIYARTNPQSSAGVWQGLNGNLAAYEPYSVAFDAVSKRLIIAAQDNGNSIQSAPVNATFNQVNSGDGVNAAINDRTLANLSALYLSSQFFGSLSRTIVDLQGNIVSPGSAGSVSVTCNGGAACGTATGAWFGSPFVLNKIDPTRIALGGAGVFLGRDTLTGANGPNAASVDLGVLTNLGNAPNFSRITTIAYGTTDNPNVVLAGGSGSVANLGLSTTGAANSLAVVGAYAGTGAVAPTGVVFDTRSSQRFYVADASMLVGTQDQGASFTNLTPNLPAGFIRPTSLEFVSNNGVNALLVGGLNNVANAQSPIAVADSDATGNLANWRSLGNGLPNTIIDKLAYNPTVDVLAISAVGRGAWTLYDFTSYFPQATLLRFGLANNDSMPTASFLTNGTIGNRALEKDGTGTLFIAGAATYTGGTTINAGTVQLGLGGQAGSILGNVAFCSNGADPNCDTSNNKKLVFNRSDSVTFDGVISGPGQVLQNGIGNLILATNSTYTGPTYVNAGVLTVNGSIVSDVFVNNGATLGGIGTVGNTQINAGGVLSPGNSIGTITVNGNLSFAPGSFYYVEIMGANADRTNVTGTATLNGTVLASFAGTSFQKEYTILHANGGLGGTTFAGLMTGGLPIGFSTKLSYDANNAYLDLTAALGTSVNGLNQNQVNVATAINGFFNNGGALPPNFAPLFGLTGTNLATALSQLSGEAATAAQYGAFQLGNEFFALMLDPLVYGRGHGLVAPTGVGPMRLAAEETQSPEIAVAYAKILKEPPAPAPILWEPRWSVWAGGYGGYNRTQGDPIVVGSHDVTARTGGYGAGIDYRIWPGTTVGVALAGGLTNWGLASGLGSGNSDAFQAGLYGITRNGPAYVAGALAFAEHWMTTDRFAFAGDHLTASFNAQSYGGRLEGGWRFATFLGGVAPYAAVQAQGFHTPGYNELDATFGGFGLNYNARNGSDTRSELGARFDHALPIAATAVLALNARAAWAHDWVTTPILNPLFQTLPGTLFSVTGATPVPNSALTSAGAELRFLNGWAIAGRFDGEFANRAQTYAGTGTIRYVW
jgi:autotransporter-associated beta strand protein